MAGSTLALLAAALATGAAGAAPHLQQRGAAPAWPNFRGAPPHQFGTTDIVVPENLSAARRWSWNHPGGQYATVIAGGPVIDAEGNFYLGTSDGIRKLGPDGQLLWHHVQEDRQNNNQPGLWEGKIYGSSQKGEAYALDAADGSLLWSKKLADDSGSDCGYPMAHDGVFMVGAVAGRDPVSFGGNAVVHALDAHTGEELWSFQPAKPVWNFAPLFPGQDNVVFMDFSGAMYSLGLHNGTLLWHAPSEGAFSSFSDGGAVLGPQGYVFSCSNDGTGRGSEGTKGLLQAFRVSDGKRMWSHLLPQPCNSYPAVGSLRAGQEPSVVVTPGSFMGSPNLHGSIMSFDATTGAPQWQFNLQAYTGPAPVFWAVGDMEGLATRLILDPEHAICLPAHWSSANIDGDGFVYAGRSDGSVYGVRAPADLPEDSAVALVSALPVDFASTPGLEVRSWHSGGSPLHGAWAFAPGTVAFSTCDTLFVFNA